MAKPTESPAYKRAVARMKKRLRTAKKPVVRDQAALARKATAKRRAAQVKAMKKPKKKPTGFFSQEMPEGNVSQMKKKVAPISKKKSTGFFSQEMPEGNVSQMKKKVVKRKNKLNTAKKPVVRDQATLAREETAKRRAAQVKAMKTPKKKSTGFFSQEMPEGKVSQMKKKVAPAKVPPKKVVPAKVPPKKVAPVKVPPKKVAPVKVPPKKVAPVKVPPKKVAPVKVPPKKVVPAKVPPKKVAPVKVPPKKVAPVKVPPKKVAPAKVPPKKVAPEGTSKATPKVTSKAAPSLDKLSFGKAFNKSRREHGGPGGMFTWKGKKYQTNIKGEDYVKNPKSVWKSNSDDNDLTEVRATGGKVTNKSRIKSTIRMTSGGGVGTKLIDDIYNA